MERPAGNGRRPTRQRINLRRLYPEPTAAVSDEGQIAPLHRKIFPYAIIRLPSSPRFRQTACFNAQTKSPLLPSNPTSACSASMIFSFSGNICATPDPPHQTPKSCRTTAMTATTGASSPYRSRNPNHLPVGISAAKRTKNRPAAAAAGAHRRTNRLPETPNCYRPDT